MAIAHHDSGVADAKTPHPYKDTPIWDLARSLQEQWAAETPADWSMVAEVLHRAIQAEHPSDGSYDKDGYWTENF